MPFTVLSSASEFDAALSSSSPLIVAFFSADWHDPSKQMVNVVKTLSDKHPEVTFVKIEAESFGQLSTTYKIESVPTFLFFRKHSSTDSKCSQIDKLSGANAAELSSLVEKHNRPLIPSTEHLVTQSSDNSSKLSLNDRLKQLVNCAPVMIFVKGTPEQPRCGFSKTLMQLFESEGVLFDSFDILSDETVRNGLKQYSNWPTYPQVYVNGELLGGLDVIKELHANGELLEQIPKQSLKQSNNGIHENGAQNNNSTQSLNDKLKQLIIQHSIMLFMKGTPEQPQCGFSKKSIDLLNSFNTKYGTFNIFSDEQVREGLKQYSNWPTYPQLYINGELIGGLDIMNELNESGELKEMIQSAQK